MQYTQYIRNSENGQLVFTQTEETLKIPSELFGFHNTETTINKTFSGRDSYCFSGVMEVTEEDTVCPECGSKMHKHGHPEIILSHLPFGSALSKVKLPHNRFKCPKCGKTKSQYLSFKADDHQITIELETFVVSLLSKGVFTNKEIAELAGVNDHLVKDIDKKRLEGKYTTDGKNFKAPAKTTRILGIDEFKLHNGYEYATLIVDMISGFVLWVSRGKRKQVVYDFIDHVGMDWMSHVEAVSCDMNSDFFEAFEERCEWIQPVFDHFHIIKNFNDKVVSEVRKDEQRRLREEGDFEAATKLKKTRFILWSKKTTLEENGQLSRYEELIKENGLLLTLDIIKEKLDEAYRTVDEIKMGEIISQIMDLCEDSKNKHLLWFRNLLDSHFEGIIAHAYYTISNGKLEGINNKIKTLRRQAYGYHDDDYFFLKIMDASHSKYVRNPKSHRIIQ